MKSDYESGDNLRITVRCFPAYTVVPSKYVAEALWIVADNMSEQLVLQTHSNLRP